MIWLILILVGGGLIGGLMAFLASDSKTSSKDNDVDIITTNGQGTQTEQGISRVPERSIYLNTTPAMTPMMQQPAMAPMMPQPQPNVPFDIPDEKKDIKNTQELNSLTSLLKNQEKIKQLEEENNKLSTEADELKLVKSDFILELNQSREIDTNNVDEDLIKLLEAVRELKHLPEANKEAIIDKIKNIPKPADGTVNLVYDSGTPNKSAQCIADLKATATLSTTPNDTKQKRLIKAMETILDNDASEKETINALEDIIIQLSRKNDTLHEANVSRISNGTDDDDNSLKGVFRHLSGDLKTKFDGFVDNLNKIYEKIRKRKIDDQGFSYKDGVTAQNADPFKPLRLTGQFLHETNTFGHVANAVSPATGQQVAVVAAVGNPNNKGFGDILYKINKQNTIFRQSQEIIKFYDDENRDKIKDKIVELNRQLFGQFELLNKATATTAKDNITKNIKGIIIDSLNNASSAKPDGRESDRKQIYNYLIKIGFKIQHADGTDIHNDCGTFKVENIQGIDSAILKDKDALPKVSDYCSKKLQINKNKKAIAQLKKNMISL